MIKLDNVSMRFNLGIEKGYSFKEAFVHFFDKNRRKTKKKKEIDLNSILEEVELDS